MNNIFSVFSKPIFTHAPQRKPVGRALGIIASLVLLCFLTYPTISRAADASSQSPSYELGKGTLTLGLELRMRVESWNGYTIKGPGKGLHDHAMLFRSKFRAEYRLPRGDRCLLELQDSRYGFSQLETEDFPATCPFEDQLDIRRAFIETPIFGKEQLSLKVGRQSITYADKRIFGPGNWGNVGRYWWDAAKLSFRLGDVRTDLLWGQRVIRERDRLDTRHDPYHMLGIYSRIGNGQRQLHVFLLDRRESEKSTGEISSGLSTIHTAGIWFLTPVFQDWKIKGTTAIQRGRRGGDSVRSWGGNIRLRRTISGKLKAYAGGEITIGSGDRNPTDGVSGTFDGVFGSVSGAYGRMNLFCWKNLRDYQLTFGMRPRGNVHIWMDLHHFELDSTRDAWYWCSGKPKIQDPRGQSGRKLGHEVDLLAKIKLAKRWELFTGASIFRGGGFLQQDSSIGKQFSWGFVQMLYRF